MKKESLVLLFLLFMVILFFPAIVHAAIVSNGVDSHDAYLDEFVKWVHSPDRWWN